MRPKYLYTLAVLLGAASAGGTQLGRVLDGGSLAQALVVFLVTWLVLALVFVGVVALLLRRRGAGRSPHGGPADSP